MMPIIDFILHIDKYISQLIDYFGIFSYLILFLIIFVETGLVITPFLPGDSLLFVVGSFAATDSFNIFIVTGLLMLAAILGDSLNYFIGSYFGDKMMKRKIIKEEYIQRTNKFYKDHGGKTIILARFTPIVRTFAPFVAGLGGMEYRKFFFYNVVGGVVWVGLFVLGGYFFGSLPIIKDNFGLFVVLIILTSAIPWIVNVFTGKKQ
ncbi:MAG TPA: DedA family protein [Candidatus Nanoarchaeia archaeon]|nr:DedA family protein [Candidatus Nanoarchaeia archaeon]